MFGTFRQLEAEKVVFGVNTYMDRAENAHIMPLLKMPFGEYRSTESLNQAKKVDIEEEIVAHEYAELLEI
jgi:hypothetical protein